MFTNLGNAFATAFEYFTIIYSPGWAGCSASGRGS
jgi:hypothetical protein